MLVGGIIYVPELDDAKCIIAPWFVLVGAAVLISALLLKHSMLARLYIESKKLRTLTVSDYLPATLKNIQQH